jgi:hypothetical protein
MVPSTALFPPGKGGGEGVARGGKSKGILIHSLTEGSGMPLANRTRAGFSSTYIVWFSEMLRGACHIASLHHVFDPSGRRAAALSLGIPEASRNLKMWVMISPSGRDAR